jgi:hypothetical protein
MLPVKLAHAETAPTASIGPISALADLEKVVLNMEFSFGGDCSRRMSVALGAY